MFTTLGKAGAALAVISLSAQAFATEPLRVGEVRSFIQENNLGQFDKSIQNSNINEEQFRKIIAAAHTIYDPIARENGETLTINDRWDDSTVNANCRRSWGDVTVNMYGGLARRPETTPDGFALVLCHELGHAYGGEPYIQRWQKMAAEGQADYYGVKDCLKAVLPLLEHDAAFDTPTPYMEQSCGEYFADADTYETCLRQLQAGQSLGSLMATIMEIDVPNYETPDTTEVSTTVTTYPDTIQCRLDTYFHGTMSLERPRCWFKD